MIARTKWLYNGHDFSVFDPEQLVAFKRQRTMEPSERFLHVLKLVFWISIVCAPFVGQRRLGRVRILGFTLSLSDEESRFITEVF